MLPSSTIFCFYSLSFFNGIHPKGKLLELKGKTYLAFFSSEARYQKPDKYKWFILPLLESKKHIDFVTRQLKAAFFYFFWQHKLFQTNQIANTKFYVLEYHIYFSVSRFEKTPFQYKLLRNIHIHILSRNIHTHTCVYVY